MSKSNVINISEIADAIDEITTEYGYLAESTVERCIESVAESTSSEINANAPRRKGGGEYASSWDYGYRKKKKNGMSLTVFSHAPYYRLAHLLEKGHLTRDGKRRTTAKPHIMPASENAEEKLIAAIKNELGG